MPNIMKHLLVRRFLAHSLEILVTFAFSLIAMSILTLILDSVNVKFEFYNTGLGSKIIEGPSSISLLDSNNEDTARYNNVLFNLYNLVILFTLFYFVFTAFNFFFSFVLLYPKNGYKVSVFYRFFGFSHFDFGKKKLSHFNKSLKMIYRETVLAFTIYTLFIIIALLNIQIVVKFLSNFMGYGNTFLDLLLTVFYLFCIFVLPALILSLITLKKTKGKQLFWDYISGVTMK